MAGNGRARVVHYLLVRHGAGAGDFGLGHARGLYIVVALLESVPKHKAQHGLRGAPRFTGKLYQVALLGLTQIWLWHPVCSW
jgi:hypothetical protein